MLGIRSERRGASYASVQAGQRTGPLRGEYVSSDVVERFDDAPDTAELPLVVKLVFIKAVACRRATHD